MMPRRGQIEAQPLMYALSAIIAVFILMFGYQAIAGFQEESISVETHRFENSLKRNFASVDYGTEFVIDLFLPAGFDKLCFVDKDLIPDITLPTADPSSDQTDHPYSPPIAVSSGVAATFPQTTYPAGTPGGFTCDGGESHPIMQSSVRSGVAKDVFLIHSLTGLTAASYFQGDLWVRDVGDSGPLNCFCVKAVGSKVSFKVEGEGLDGTKVIPLS